MGYEIKLFIGNEGYAQETRKYFQVWAMIDICKAGYDSNIHKIKHGNNDPNVSWYVYGLDCNIQFDTDRYGERLGPPIPIDVFIKALAKDAKTDDYRRYKWALDLMKSIKKNQGEDAKVIWWGY